MSTCICIASTLALARPSYSQIPSPASTVSYDGNAIITAFSPSAVPASYMTDSINYKLLTTGYPEYTFQAIQGADTGTFTTGVEFCPDAPDECASIVVGAREALFTYPDGTQKAFSGGMIQAVYHDPSVKDKNFIQIYSTSVPVDALAVDAANPGFPFYNEHAPRRVAGDNNQIFYAPDRTGDGDELFFDLSARNFARDGQLPEPPQRHGDEIDWSATVWPVAVDGQTVVAHNGMQWGWYAVSSLLGYYDAEFLTPPESCSQMECVIQGSQIQYGAQSLSELLFAPNSIDPFVGESFAIGNVTLYAAGEPGPVALGHVSLSIGANLTHSFPNEVTLQLAPQINFLVSQSPGGLQCARIKPTADTAYAVAFCPGAGESKTFQVVGKVCMTTTGNGLSAHHTYTLLIEGLYAANRKIKQLAPNDCSMIPPAVAERVDGLRTFARRLPLDSKKRAPMGSVRR